METAQDDLANFTRFAQQRIDSGQSGLSLDQFFGEWRAENPTDTLHAENVAAVQASITDFQRGERGTIAGQHSSKLRHAFGTPQE